MRRSSNRVGKQHEDGSDEGGHRNDMAVVGSDDPADNMGNHQAEEGQISHQGHRGSSQEDNHDKQDAFDSGNVLSQTDGDFFT